ncbi:MAG TPA: M13 family peptidase, partial [Rhodothermales bacterium]|nr:M13 family peptidase [Rhodothermales bacterium]
MTRRSLVLAALAAVASPALAQTAPLGLGVDTTAMDRSVRPQDDLFRYTNGAWLETLQIPDDKSRYGSFDILREKAERDVRAIIEDAAAGRVSDPDAAKIGAIYTAYMDSARVEQLGVSPLAPDFARIDAVASRDDLARYFAGNTRSFGPSPLAAFVTVDARNSSQHITAIWQTGTGLPDRSYYLEDGFADERAAYLDYLERIHTLAGLPGDARQSAETVLDLETQIARAQWTRVENRNPEARYNKMGWRELAVTYPHVRFPILMSASGFPAVDSVIVNQPSYVAALDRLMQTVPLEDWKTWARVRTVSEAAGLLSSDFADASFDFYGRTLSGQQADRVRWKKAVSAASGAMGESVGRIYVARHFPPAAKARMDEMIRNLQTAMRQSISELEWMSAATKEAALAKLDDYTFKIGYPDEWEDYSALEVRPDDLVGNSRRISEWRWNDMLADLGQAPDRGEWGMTPQTVNAYYNPSFNEIVFPAAILQPPFFNVEADDA